MTVGSWVSMVTLGKMQICVVNDALKQDFFFVFLLTIYFPRTTDAKGILFSTEINGFF